MRVMKINVESQNFYLLTSPLLTNHGNFQYTSLSLSEAEKILSNHDFIVSQQPNRIVDLITSFLSKLKYFSLIIYLC